MSTFNHALDTYFKRENKKQNGNLRREKDATSQLSTMSAEDNNDATIQIKIDVIHSIHKQNEENKFWHSVHQFNIMTKIEQRKRNIIRQDNG